VGRRQVMEPQPLHLGDVVLETAELLRPLIGEEIELRLELDEKLGMVEADPVQIQQVLLNLATNARDAMPGGGTLTIATANLQLSAPQEVGGTAIPPGAWVTLSVADTGRGMDRELQERAFEPFFSTKVPGHGTGLGLSSVYGIVEPRGALLSLESRVGEGSCFCISLPRLADVAEVAGKPVPRAPIASRTGTVLLAEDDATLRRLLRRILTAQGHTVLEAADGVAALELARRHRGHLDAVLTDVVMPRGSGRALAEGGARRHPQARGALLTGYTAGAVLLRGVSAQEVKLLRKPFPLEALSAVLADVLGRREERR